MLDHSSKAPLGISMARSQKPSPTQVVSLLGTCRLSAESTSSFTPSSERTAIPTSYGLVGEQSNAYRILLRYDRKSRHRRIKKQRRYERLAATSQLSLW